MLKSIKEPLIVLMVVISIGAGMAYIAGLAASIQVHSVPNRAQHWLMP